MWNIINEVCDKEIFSYTKESRGLVSFRRYTTYLGAIADIDDFVSALEIGLKMLLAVADEQDYERSQRGAKIAGQAAIDEINARFRQHAFGFQFENGEIFRIDSFLTHEEIVKPALALLTNKMFIKANDDFLTAHRHYRSGEWKDSVTSFNRAFESTLKAICDTENWTYDKSERAAELVTKVNAKGLFTHDFDRSFTAYVGMLKAGLPSVRNDAGGHGEGLAAVNVTPEIARFALNMTATNIRFLGEVYEQMKRRERKRLG